MPAVAPEFARPRRSVLSLSLGITFLAVVTILAAIFVVGAPEAEANSCTLTGGPILPPGWSNFNNWSTCGGTYPGANAGDTAIVGQTITVDVVVPNGVILQITGFGANVNIPGAPGTNSLQLEPSSTLGSGGNATGMGRSLMLSHHPLARGNFVIEPPGQNSRHAW